MTGCHVLKSPTEVRNALRYVLLNGRRHAGKLRRLSGAVRIDPASSGRWFDGWKRVARVEPASDQARPPPVARPHTWLLRIGWRRRGLIDPADVPGG